MTNIKLLAALLLALSFYSCKTYQPDNLPDTQLRFGQGGGFTGAVTEYLLLENGQIFVREELEGAYQSLGKVKRARAKALFEQWVTGSFSEKEFQHPGNMYYYVNRVDGSQAHRLTWGSSDHPVSDELRSFYQSCYAIVKEIQE